MPTDPIHRLQSAARRAAAHVAPGVVATRVVVYDGDGTKKILDAAIPPGEIPSVDLIGPAAPGWEERDGRAFFDGLPVPVTGRKLAVLKVLIDHETAGLNELREAWGGVTVEESSVRWQIGELKKVLKVIFPEFPGEIPTVGAGGYSLHIR